MEKRNGNGKGNVMLYNIVNIYICKENEYDLLIMKLLCFC